MSPNNTHDEVGFVTEVKHYLFSVEGLPSARINDILTDEDGNRAIVRALNNDNVTALSLGKVYAKPGDRYMLSSIQHLFSCGDHLFGRIITTLGDPADGGESFPKGNTPFAVEVDAPGIEHRVPIHEQLYSGITLVDTLVPIAKGQRQLVFGPMNSGITTFLTEIIRNQQWTDVVCIYVAIGKPINGLREITDKILSTESGRKTIVISALSDDPTPVIALAPSVSFLIADYFRARGDDVLIVLDDLDAHAKYLREIALLEERLPSTESYPGDIFYQHAHLMERSGHFGPELGGGSITTLPVIKTNLKNYSDLIPTNLMACTDGHLAFRSELYAQGTYPSISFEESVTRVGRHAQRLLQKQITSRVQILLAQYKKQREYSQFSAQLSDDAKRLLRQGEIVEELLRQTPYQGIRADVQVPLLTLAFTPFLLERGVDFIKTNKKTLIQALTEEGVFEALRVKALEDTPFALYAKEVEDLRELFETICRP
jgi:F-type H+/Na+-transporting ATPase subunit alpha